MSTTANGVGATSQDYDPNTPDEIKRADMLDRQDLAAGRDLDREQDPQPRPRRTQTRGERVDLLAFRYSLRLALFNRVGDGYADTLPFPLPKRRVRPGRKRRPSELERTAAFRADDAARKREERQRKREGGDDAA